MTNETNTPNTTTTPAPRRDLNRVIAPRDVEMLERHATTLGALVRLVKRADKDKEASRKLRELLPDLNRVYPEGRKVVSLARRVARAYE